jgi:hypothetical protein
MGIELRRMAWLTLHKNSMKNENQKQQQTWPLSL